MTTTADPLRRFRRLRPRAEWHCDDGPVLWWTFPVAEPPWLGTPLDSDWPGHHTHWTPPIVPHEPPREPVP